jgi:diadenosine tetraphosphate (Ap4A) HIT family hydrolase
MFELHTQLAKDCAVVGDLALCRVLLMNDAGYPRLILVPRRDGVEELFQLSLADQRQLIEEVSGVAEALASHARADKMNVAALGNVVPQLHVHIIARRREDPAWPRPVWGVQPAQPYEEVALAEQLAELLALLQPLGLERG